MRAVRKYDRDIMVYYFLTTVPPTELIDETPEGHQLQIAPAYTIPAS